MSDTIPAGAATTNRDVRVLLVITAPRTRMHIRRLLASAPGIDVIGHAQSAPQLGNLLQRGGVNFIIVDTPEDPAFAQAALDAARTAGVDVAVLTDDSRFSASGLGSRIHVLPPPADITAVVPQSPFCQSLLAAVFRRANIVVRRP